MRRIRGIVGGGALTAAVLVGSVMTSTVASAQTGFDVLLSGLSSPKGLALSQSGNPIVGQGAFGPPGPILLYKLSGPDAGSTVDLTAGPENVMDVAMAPDGSLWWIGGDQVVYRQDPAGVVHTVLDVPTYQATDPDPFDQEGNPTESNPYGLAVLPSGDALVADAASNDLLRVSPSGTTTTVARFDVEAVSTDHLPDPLPPTIDAESVPTSVTLGPDGWAYVAELKGFPFRPGSSNVWRVNVDADGAVCSVNTVDPDCSLYRTGLTAIQDIAFRPRTSVLFVYELAADGVLAFEAGFETGDFPPAVLLKVKNDRRMEIAEGLLSQPGGISVRGDGRVLVTDGIFGDGRLVGLGL